MISARKVFDFYVDRPSIVHRLPDVLKLLLAVAVVIVTAFMPRPGWSYLAAMAAALLVVTALARLPFGILLKRVLLFEPFVAGVAVLTLFQPHGLAVALAIIARSSLCLLTMMILTGTTSFAGILRALQQLHLPSIMISSLALTYRYVFLLYDELLTMQRARASRTFSGRTRGHWFSLSGIIAQLFVRTSLRAERVYSAMCARGWKA
jgi:cobalt/nickel transport system permease protein